MAGETPRRHEFKETTIRNIKVKGRTEFSDTALDGLHLRVTPKGTKTWRLLYRVKLGPNKREKTKSVTLGKFPALSVADARRKAGEYKDHAEEGVDLALEKATLFEERIEARELTFAVAADNYLNEAKAGRKVGRKGGISSAVYEVRKHDLEDVLIPLMGHRPLAEIKTRDLTLVLDEVDKQKETKKAPTRVDRMLNAIRAVFYYSVELRQYIDFNPADRLKPRIDMRERERDRVLRDIELRALWLTTGGLGNYGKVIRVLTLTGQRLGEITGLRWKNIDLEKSVLKLRAAETKARRVHHIPLSKPVVEIIKGQPRGKAGELIFPNHEGGEFQGFSKLKKRIDKLMVERLAIIDEGAVFEGWRVHDLRRTAATGMGEAGTANEIIGLILNHQTNLGTTGIYNRQKFDTQMKDGLDKWAVNLMEIVGPDLKLADERSDAS